MQRKQRKQRKQLLDPGFLEKVKQHNDMMGYQGPDGRITYNKIATKTDFGMFTDIIASMVPHGIVHDESKRSRLPSIARVIDTESSNIEVYPTYVFLNMTMEDYMDYEDEEDQDSITALLEHVDMFPYKTPVIGCVVQKSEIMETAHGMAFIVWKVNGRYKFAYYDSLAYHRKTKSYDYAERAFVGSRFEHDIEFINLNTYCFKGEEEGDFHCSQYVINAEYCFIYAIFFLTRWIENGHLLHRASFKKAIKMTYVVEPSKLTRANNRESMVYRVVMMSFICQTLLAFLQGLSKNEKRYILGARANIRRINTYLAEFTQKYGFSLHMP